MRIALVCSECNHRHMGDPNWRCPDHPGKTVIQRNRPYMGQELAQPEIEGLRIVDAMDAPGKKKR